MKISIFKTVNNFPDSEDDECLTVEKITPFID